MSKSLQVSIPNYQSVRDVGACWFFVRCASAAGACLVAAFCWGPEACWISLGFGAETFQGLAFLDSLHPERGLLRPLRFKALPSSWTANFEDVLVANKKFGYCFGQSTREVSCVLSVNNKPKRTKLKLSTVELLAGFSLGLLEHDP